MMPKSPNLPFRVSAAPEMHTASSSRPTSPLSAIVSLMIDQGRRVSGHRVYDNLIRAFSSLIGSSLVLCDHYLSPSSIAPISGLSLPAVYRTAFLMYADLCDPRIYAHLSPSSNVVYILSSSSPLFTSFGVAPRSSLIGACLYIK